MSLKIGIVGLPNVGKSTLFQALTRKQVDTSNYPFATIEPNVGIVEVEDERLDTLAKLMESERKIPAIVEFIDIAGLVKGASEGEGLGNKFLAHIREVDAVLEVVRTFEDPKVVHVESSIDAGRDESIIETEFFMADLETVGKVRLRAEKETKTGRSDAKKYLDTVLDIEKSLGEGKSVSRELAGVAKELNLLSVKPRLHLYNVKDEQQYGENAENRLTLNIKLEEELSRMQRDEQKELGLEPELGELVRKAYAILGLISFFTTGPDETRAWTIPQGSNAKRAGRAIHSDFEEKFIRAEVIFWEDLIKAESVARAREKGLLRTEGKDYIVNDGDIIEFKI